MPTKPRKRGPMISIIIPTLNEAENIDRCMKAVLAESSDFEVIIADGGSSDNTKTIVSGYPGVKIVDFRKGRGIQMNSGALAATGDVLLFLHADTRLEQGWAKSIMETLRKETFIGGAFTFAIDNYAWQYRIIETWVRLRCSLFKLPYGDQAIFVRKNVFTLMRGYKDIPLMEDVDFIKRLRKMGRTIILNKKAFTSERRWENKGLLKTIFINQITMLLYKLGVSPERLFRLYYR